MEQELFQKNAGRPGASQQVVFEHWYRSLISTRYALCLFQSRHESIAMWRLYAPHGFAIRTSFRALAGALQASGRKWRISQMKYVDREEEVTAGDESRDEHFNETLRRPFLLKSREYEYEKEVRLFTVDPGALPTLVVEGVSPEKWIEEIRISPEMWREDAEFAGADRATMPRTQRLCSAVRSPNRPQF
jgi:hypothetical protein